MNVTVNTEVSYAVKDVRVKSLTFRLKATGLLLEAPYVWLDAEGKVVRTGTNKYDEATLLASFAAQGVDLAPLLSIFKGVLAPVAECKILRIDLTTPVTATMVQVGAEGKYVSVMLDEAQLSASLAPVTLEQLQQMVAGFTAAVLAA
jgi:hypothetical protein